jgi:hypothetical protein
VFSGEFQRSFLASLLLCVGRQGGTRARRGRTDGSASKHCEE